MDEHNPRDAALQGDPEQSDGGSTGESPGGTRPAGAAWVGVEFAALLAIPVLVVHFELAMPAAIPLLALASLSLWLRGGSWIEQGLAGHPRAPAHVAAGLGLGACSLVIAQWLWGPLIEGVSGLAVEWKPAIPMGGNAELLLQLLILAWAGAVAGEMVFRGHLIPRLAPVLGGDAWRAVIASAVGYGWVVALGHDATFAQWLGGFALGSGYGLLYLAAGRNLLLPIACHGGFDTAYLVLAYWQPAS